MIWLFGGDFQIYQLFDWLFYIIVYSSTKFILGDIIKKTKNASESANLHHTKFE